MGEDIVTRLRCSYADPPCEECTFCMARAEIERLQRWKAEACSVLADWDAIYVGLGDRGELGQRKSAVVAAEIERLRVDAEQADAGVAWLTSKIGHLLAAGDALVAAIRNHDLAEAHLKAWQEARRG